MNKVNRTVSRKQQIQSETWQKRGKAWERQIRWFRHSGGMQQTKVSYKGLGWVICLTTYQSLMGYLNPKFDSFLKAGFISLTAYQLLWGYLIPGLDLFVNAWFGLCV